MVRIQCDNIFRVWHRNWHLVITQELLAVVMKQVFKHGVMSPTEDNRGPEPVTQVTVGLSGGEWA